MQQGDGYWGVLQTLLAIVLVAIGLRFAVPRLRFPMGALMVLVLALAALVPGAPVWFRICSAVCAVVPGLGLWRSLPRTTG